MAHHRGQESQPGYMDSVCVKISEKYKPPPRINLITTLSQRLSLNTQIGNSLELYDFTLENNLKHSMTDLKEIRRIQIENKRDKLDKIKAVRKKEAELEASRKTLDASTSSDLGSKSQCTSEASQVENPGILYPTTYSHILTPTPLVNNVTSQNSPSYKLDKSLFNFADFEADTSSPFDNMELKTINDIEALAQVLTRDNSSDNHYNQTHSNYTPVSTSAPMNYSQNVSDLSKINYPTYNIPVRSNTSLATVYNGPNGVYYPLNQNVKNHYSSTKPDIAKVPLRNINDISKSLQNTHSLDKLRIEQNNLKTEKNKNDLEDIYELLPKNLQRLSQNVSSMGFPLPRVARACQALGDDQKKVVEYLLVMTDLLDLGFSEKDILKALIECDNDRDKALDILIM